MKGKMTLTFLLITVLLDSAAFGIIMPVLPDLIEELTYADISAASIWGGYLMFSFGIMQFLCGPLIGNLSDAFGRRPVLLFSLLGMVVDFVLMALAPTMIWLFIGRILGGITTATHSTVNAVIADISDDSNRARNFGLIGASFGVGFILGPSLGGVLSQFGVRAPFFGAAIVALANLIFGLYVFKETLDSANRRKFDLLRGNPFGALMQLRKNRALVPMMIIFAFYNLAFVVYPAVWSFFTQFQFGWESWLVGLSLSGFGVCMAISQGFLVKPIIDRWGARRVLRWGLLIQAVVFGFLAFMTNEWLLLVIMPLSALAGVTGPAFSDLMSRMVDKNEQGELQGIMSSIMALTMTFGPLLMTASFRYFTTSEREMSWAGAPFILSLMCMLVGAIIYFRVVRNVPPQEK